ncbi:hypothetical protein V8E53_015857 [Lactarius tabidus]
MWESTAILDWDRAEEGSCNGLWLICLEIIYSFEYGMFQSPVPLPVGAVNVRIVLRSFDDLVDLKLHRNCWLHKKEELSLALENCSSRVTYGEESLGCQIYKTTGQVWEGCLHVARQSSTSIEAGLGVWHNRSTVVTFVVIGFSGALCSLAKGECHVVTLSLKLLQSIFNIDSWKIRTDHLAPQVPHTLPGFGGDVITLQSHITIAIFNPTKAKASGSMIPHWMF